jgi:hypothetical protein
MGSSLIHQRLMLNLIVQRFRKLAVLIAAALLTACGGGDDDKKPSEVVFAFRLHGFPATQEFRAKTSSPEVIAQARAQLKLPEAERNLFAIGPIAAGNGGYNLAWQWHYSDFALAELAIELCDGTPTLVEDDLEYWLTTVKSFCPWASYVHAEIK